MEIEKEVRYSATKEQINKIISLTEVYKEKTSMLDITCGYKGFESYKEYGYICRIRQKQDKISLDVKKYINEQECLEQSIELDKVSTGVNFLKLIGMEPYLYLKRDREIRKYGNLKIFIDEFDILGDYIEIEYQNSEEGIHDVNKFVERIGINGEPKDMYGGIVQQRLKLDMEFKKKFESKLDEVISDL